MPIQKIFELYQAVKSRIYTKRILDTDWLFVENNLYGGHVGEHSVTGGYYSFYNKLERLNLAIETFNRLPIHLTSI